MEINRDRIHRALKDDDKVKLIVDKELDKIDRNLPKDRFWFGLIGGAVIVYFIENQGVLSELVQFSF